MHTTPQAPRLSVLAAAAAALLAGLPAAPLHAQEADTVITISAQRRIEEMQKVPLAVTALSSRELELKQIRRLDDLKVEVPNVIIEPNTGTSSGAKIFMRGVGTDESLFTADPSVAIYIDDTYVARQTGAMFDMFDLSRVEVLRGPQGTLYGRNATGGAIRYITKKPGGESRLEIDTRIGNLGRKDTQLSGGGMPLPGVSASFGLMLKDRDGYLTDLTNGGKLNDEQMVGGRLSLAFNLGASTSARLSLDSLRQRSGPTYASGVLDAAGATRFNRPVNNADGKLYTVETNLTTGSNDLDQGGFSFSTASDMGSFEWRNIVSHRRMDNALYIDLDGTTGTRFHLYQDQSQKQTQVETQLVSTGKGPFSWTGGIFFFKEDNFQPTRQDIFSPGGTNDVSQETTASAIYGQGDVRFGGIFKATGGLRYSKETKSAGIFGRTAAGVNNFTFNGKNTWTRTDWKLGLDAQVSPTMLAYASATTGFKSGGFNGRAANLAAAQLILKPETVTTYELGLKTTLMGGAGRFNITLFQNDYKDLQLTAFNTTGASVLFNAASAVIKGVEIDANAQFNKSFSMGLNLGTLDAKYRDYAANNAAIFDGKQLKQAPKLTYGVNANYRAPMGSGQLVAGAQLKFVDDHYQNLANSEIIKTQAYTTVDARVGYEAAGNKWSVALWGRNLTNEQYFTGGFDISGLGIAAAYLNLPRTYGLDFKYRFW